MLKFRVVWAAKKLQGPKFSSAQEHLLRVIPAVLFLFSCLLSSALSLKINFLIKLVLSRRMKNDHLYGHCLLHIGLWIICVINVNERTRTSGCCSKVYFIVVLTVRSWIKQSIVHGGKGTLLQFDRWRHQKKHNDFLSWGCRWNGDIHLLRDGRCAYEFPSVYL